VLRTRVLTALVALPAFLLAVYALPKSLFTALVLCATAIGLAEVIAFCNCKTPVSVALFIASLSIALFVLRQSGSTSLVCAVVSALLLLTCGVAVKGGDWQLGRAILPFLGPLYVSALFPYFALLRNRAGGIKTMLLVILLVVIGDSAAYFAGTRWGSIKLLPRVSPNKTVEGALASLGSNLLFAWIWWRWMMPQTDFKTLLSSIAGLNFSAQVGDLVESALKRLARLKESGSLFPGHGGLLDRADSLVFATIFAYYYLG